MLPYFLNHYLTRPGAASLMICGVAGGSVLGLWAEAFIGLFSLLLLRASCLFYRSSARICMSRGVILASWACITFAVLARFCSSEWLRVPVGRRGTSYLGAQSYLSMRCSTSLSVFVWYYRAHILDVFTVMWIWVAGAEETLAVGFGYWKAQHSVARGGQPWIYHLLVPPLTSNSPWSVAGVDANTAVARSFRRPSWCGGLSSSLGMYSGDATFAFVVHPARRTFGCGFRILRVCCGWYRFPVFLVPHVRRKSIRCSCELR